MVVRRSLKAKMVVRFHLLQPGIHLLVMWYNAYMGREYIPRKRQSPVWVIPAEQLKELLLKNTSNTQILLKIGVAVTGGNRAALKRRAEEEGLAEYYTVSKPGWPTGRTRAKKEYDYAAIFAKDSGITRSILKHVMIRDGLVKHECAVCQLLPEWNGKSLVLVLDHENGDATDNRLENLRLLCPNCNSQTDTFSWKNMWKKKRERTG